MKKLYRTRVWNPGRILSDEAYDAYLRIHPLGIFANGDGTYRIESTAIEINQDLTLSQLNDMLISISNAIPLDLEEENTADKA